MIPNLDTDYEQIDLSNIGKLFILDETLFTPEQDVNRDDILYLAQLLGIAPYTKYLLLTQEETFTIYKALKIGGDQAEFLIKCEGLLEKANKTVISEHNKRIAAEDGARFSVTLNWVLVPTTIALTIGLIYFITH